MAAFVNANGEKCLPTLRHLRPRLRAASRGDPFPMMLRHQTLLSHWDVDASVRENIGRAQRDNFFGKASRSRAGRSAWFVGVLLLLVYAVFAITLYLLPPQVQ
jgi:hypothetical protein